MIYRSISLAVFLLVFASTTTQSQDLPTSPPSQSQAEERRSAEFRSEVDQVVIYASVYNSENQLVSDLKANDFSVFENKIEQDISYFGQDDIPSTVGIVIDSSGSMRDKFRLVNEATRLFLEMSNPENELFLITFKNEAELEEGFTRDVEDIHDGLDNIIVSGGTALYDAIFLAVDMSHEGSEAKKIIVVFTDGEDRDSYYAHEELLNKVRESDVQIYIVAFLDVGLSRSGGIFGIFKSQREKVQATIQSITDYTGGISFFPKKITELNDVFQSIARELQQQYRLAYISNNSVLDGQWRDIDVKIQDQKAKGLKIRAKRGYFTRKTVGQQSPD